MGHTPSNQFIIAKMITVFLFFEISNLFVKIVEQYDIHYTFDHKSDHQVENILLQIRANLKPMILAVG